MSFHKVLHELGPRIMPSKFMKEMQLHEDSTFRLRLLLKPHIFQSVVTKDYQRAAITSSF